MWWIPVIFLLALLLLSLTTNLYPGQKNVQQFIDEELKLTPFRVDIYQIKSARLIIFTPFNWIVLSSDQNYILIDVGVNSCSSNETAACIIKPGKQELYESICLPFNKSHLIDLFKNTLQKKSVNLDVSRSRLENKFTILDGLNMLIDLGYYKSS